MIRHLFGSLLLACLLPGVVGCREDISNAPPQIRCGRDVCAECGMIINEEKFAAALVVEREGLRENLLFDDVGDMLDYEPEHQEVTVLARYVHDLNGRGWVAAESAHYLHGTSIFTPMRSGIVAFADEPGCAASRAKSGGTCMALVEVRRARAAGQAAPR